MNPSNPNAEPNTREMQEAARTLGLELHVLNASTELEIDAAFPILMGRHIEALVIDGDPFYSSQIEQLAALTLRHGIPAIYATRDFVDAGGLIIYGASNTDAYRVAGGYVGRILKGDKPADLPVQQVTKVELIINLKTAKTLGLTLPETLLATANEVIQ
jgi:putative tryptophan/tyrosine transport system substrate-binding protein